MTDIEKRIFIAEKVLTPEDFALIRQAAESRGWEAAFDFYSDRFKTNYPNDLNASAEMEKVLDHDQGNQYLAHLAKSCVTLDKLFPQNRKYFMDGTIAHATSKQRADAFIAVMKGELPVKTSTQL